MKIEAYSFLTVSIHDYLNNHRILPVCALLSSTLTYNLVDVS